MDHRENSSGPPGPSPARIVIGDLRYSGLVLIAIGAGTGWAAWTGGLVWAVVLVFPLLTAVATVVLLLALLTLPSRRTWAENLRRMAIQGILTVMLSVPILIAGWWVEKLSIRTSQHRGDRIAEALDAYRTRHGTYPKSLGSLTDDSMASLPRPTTSDHFGYDVHGDGSGFNLTFAQWDFLFPSRWIRESGSKGWSLQD